MSEKIVWGNVIPYNPSTKDLLITDIQNENVICKHKEYVNDGDVRFWGVDMLKYPLLTELYNFAIKEYYKKKGFNPKCAFIMVNKVSAKKSPTGSGGGWHRDMWKEQYKAFMYLNDVQRETQGAFAYIEGTNNLFIRSLSLVKRLITGNNRYTDNQAKKLNQFGFKTIPVFAKSETPFFVNTSLIHRGLPITEGERFMATVYIYDEINEKINYC